MMYFLRCDFDELFVNTSIDIPKYSFFQELYEVYFAIGAKEINHL